MRLVNERLAHQVVATTPRRHPILRGFESLPGWDLNRSPFFEGIFVNGFKKPMTF